MKKNILILLFILAFLTAKTQSLYFPPLIGNTWDTISITSLGWCQDKVDTLLNYLGNKNTKAFMLLKNGKIVIEKYYGTFTQDSAWYWASAGKSLTAFIVGIAQQEGNLSINDTTSDYLGTGWTVCTLAQEEKITIRNQLTMTSGLDDGVPDHYCTLDTCLQYKTDAGTRWAYHNGPYTLLDGVIQNATGQSLTTYFTQKVKIPTGITGVFLPSGYNNVFYSKPRSMARFGLLILNKGKWNTNQVLTDTAYFNHMTNTSQALNRSYGYLWWLNGKQSYMVPGFQFVFPGSLNPNAPNDMIAALGKNGQFINVVPSQNLVYIRMGNAPNGGEVPFLMNDTIWQKLNEVMCTTSSITNTIAKEKEIELFPNPACDFFTVAFLNQNYAISIVDMIGRVVYENSNVFNKIIIPTEKFSEGVYSVKIQQPNSRIFNKKLIITR